MFFSLEHTTNARMPCQWQMGSLVLNTDQGWHKLVVGNRMLIYKGYADTTPLRDIVADCADHQVPGNFCVFDYNSNTGTIAMRTNQWRGFLAWYTQNIMFSNLYTADKCLWNDGSATIDQSLHVVETTLDVIDMVNTHSIDLATALDDIHAILSAKTQQFVRNNSLPLRVFCSGGVDTALVYSYIKRATAKYELLLGNHNDWDSFWCNNSKLLTQRFWAYRNIHHWHDPCVVTSGTLGDECMLKNPSTANLWLMYHGIDIHDLLASTKYRNCSHYDFYNSTQSRQLYQTQQQDPAVLQALELEPAEFYKYICNIVMNDCQHWHLGNTLTFTPLRDFDIFKIMLRLDPKHAIPQMFNSDISKQLIVRNDPSILETLSYCKGVGEELENLSSLINSHT